MTGFICGAWDLLHAGHVLALKECKNHCDYLIVGLHIDPSIERKEKNKPIQSVFERMVQLQGCKYVDKIIMYETENELEKILCSLNIDKRFLGSDYISGKNITAKDAIEIVFINRNHNYSSTELRERIKNA